MTLEILHVKLTEVHSCAVWISTLIIYKIHCYFPVCVSYLYSIKFLYVCFEVHVVLILWCTGTRCQHKFAINVVLVRQFSAIKSKNCHWASGCDQFENMTENVQVCF